LKEKTLYVLLSLLMTVISNVWLAVSVLSQSSDGVCAGAIGFLMFYLLAVILLVHALLDD